MKLVDWLLIVPAAGLGLWLILHDPDLRWDEEVQLQTGEVIVIQRTAKFSEHGMVGGGGESPSKDMTIEFKYPTRPDNPSTWRGTHAPMIIDRDPDTHEWFVVASLYSCDDEVDTGQPASPYVAYQYREGKWLQQSMNPKWKNRYANLAVIHHAERRHIGDRHPIFTISDKEKLFREHQETSQEYKKFPNKHSKRCRFITQTFSTP